MPLLAKEHLAIPTKDIISWCYDGRNSFDQDKPIYIDVTKSSRSISANQAYALIRKLVAGLRAAGLQKGDVVCLHAFNNLYYPLLVQGIIAAGAAFVGTNPSYTPFELEHALRLSKAKFIITEPDILKAPTEAASKLGIPLGNIYLFEENEVASKYGHPSWRRLLEHGEQDWVKFDDLETAQSTPACLMFSSGTTGLPKAAIQSHYNIIAEHTLVHENKKKSEPYHMSRLICLPLMHTSVLPYALATTLRSGRESYMMRRFVLSDFLTYMQRYQITNMMLVPPMVVAIVQAARQDEAFVKKSLSSVKAAVGGAAPLDTQTQASLQVLLPKDAAFTQIWAMTETTCIACYLYYPENDNTGSIGRFVPNMDVKLVNPDPESGGREVGPYDTRGELCIRGPTVIRGYLNNPEANARDWDNEGYFHSGDIVYCDSKTELWYVVDRKKELIKVRGFQVAPNEIEGVLLSHPKIKDAAVIGVPNREAGSELPLAYIVGGSEGDESLTEDEVKSWVRARLARYKELSGGVKFVESIPKTPSGKILKRILREETIKSTRADIKL